MMETSFNDRHISFQQSIQFVCMPSNRDDILQDSRRFRKFRLGLQELCYSPTTSIRFGVKQIAKDLNVNHVLGQIIAGHGRWLMVVVPSLIGEIWFSSLRLVGISRILWLLLLGN